MSTHGLALLALFLAATFWGIAPVVMKLALVTIPPFSLQLLRFIFASIFILPFFLKTKKDLKADFLKLILFSLLPFLNVTFFILGIGLTTATASIVIYAATPFVVTFLSRLLFKERISLIKTAGVSVGFLGVLLIIFAPGIEHGVSKSGDIKGNLIISLGLLAFSFYTLLAKPILKKHSPVVTTALFIWLTAFLSLPLSAFELVNDSSWLRSLSFKPLLGVFYLASFATIATFFLYQWAIKHSSPLEASLIFYFQPVVTYTTAALVLQERLTFLFIIGAVVALLGVFLTTTLSYLKNTKV